MKLVFSSILFQIQLLQITCNRTYSHLACGERNERNILKYKQKKKFLSKCLSVIFCNLFLPILEHQKWLKFLWGVGNSTTFDRICIERFHTFWTKKKHHFSDLISIAVIYLRYKVSSIWHFFMWWIIYIQKV